MNTLFEEKDFLKPFSEPDETKFTINKYKIGDSYTEEREKDHYNIIYAYLNDKEPNDDKVAILLGGGAGAGKSTILNYHFFGSSNEDYKNFVHIDSDEIKEKIKEYKDYLNDTDNDTRVYAAFYVHRESTDIADKIIEHCIQEGLSFIYDGTMTYLPHYENLLDKLKTNAYIVLGLYVDVAVEVAMYRVQKRALSGRFVDLNYTELSNRNSAINFYELKGEFDHVLMYNNTLPIDEIENYHEFFKDEPTNIREFRVFHNKILLGELKEEDLKDDLGF